MVGMQPRGGALEELALLTEQLLQVVGGEGRLAIAGHGAVERGDALAQRAHLLRHPAESRAEEGRGDGAAPPVGAQLVPAGKVGLGCPARRGGGTNERVDWMFWGGGVGGVAAWLQLCDSDGQWVTARTTALPLYVPDGRWACKSMFVAELKPGDE